MKEHGRMDGYMKENILKNGFGSLMGCHGMGEMKKDDKEIKGCKFGKVDRQ